MSQPCDRFGRTPEIVALRHDQGAALELVHRSLAAINAQRVFRGFMGRRNAKKMRLGVTAVEKRISGATITTPPTAADAELAQEAAAAAAAAAVGSGGVDVDDGMHDADGRVDDGNNSADALVGMSEAAVRQETNISSQNH